MLSKPHRLLMQKAPHKVLFREKDTEKTGGLKISGLLCEFCPKRNFQCIFCTVNYQVICKNLSRNAGFTGFNV